jgi:hypothetical protein
MCTWGYKGVHQGVLNFTYGVLKGYLSGTQMLLYGYSGVSVVYGYWSRRPCCGARGVLNRYSCAGALRGYAPKGCSPGSGG